MNAKTLFFTTLIVTLSSGVQIESQITTGLKVAADQTQAVYSVSKAI